MTNPRELGFGDLVWSHFSRPRFGDFDDRVAAAGAAGMDGIGLYIFEYERLRNEEGRSAADIRDVLDRHDVCLADVEVSRGWSATEGDDVEYSKRIEELAFEMADEFGVRYLQAIGSYTGGVDHAAEAFAGLCDRAAEHGLLVGIEWLPYTNIADAADAQEIVRLADRPNAGYCIDIWHHTRGANDMAMITALEPERVFAIQMNDGALVPAIDDYKTDCLASRVPPGDGEFDCVGFIRTLHDMGVDAPISLEVCSTELWQAPAIHAAQVAADGMRRVLDAAGVDRRAASMRDAGSNAGRDDGAVRS